MVSSGTAAERGILFRNGTELENAYRADCVVLDKTGTLTTGHPELTDVHPLPGVTERELILLCAAPEREGIDTGALSALPDVRLDAKAEICICRDGVLIGTLGVADTLKSEAAEAVRQLKDAGKEVWMLTGDNERTAKAIAAKAGIDNILFEIRRVLENGGYPACPVGAPGTNPLLNALKSPFTRKK